MNREELKHIALETMRITNRGSYNNIELHIEQMVTDTRLVRDLDIRLNKQPDWYSIKPNVVNKGVVDTAIDLHKQNPHSKITILNFASAKNPGGGFLNGSQAQEESIARATTLCKSLRKYDKEFYQYHRDLKSPLYSNLMIHSPNVEIIRSDNGELLETPISIDVISCAAPNAGVARDKGLEPLSINIHMKDRIYRIVQLAKNIDTDILILGAFGCGVFKNDSVFTSSNFERAINRIILRDSMTIKFAIVGKVPRGFY